MSLGKSTTAEEALRGVSLAGKTVIVTGANSGIGAETARVLGHAGAKVIMACRTIATGEETATRIRAEKESTLEVLPLDLTDLDSIRKLADVFLARNEPLHLLINNAGVMATPHGKTKQGIELQVGTNHVGHFLLTKLLLPALEKADAARIVNVSSALHTRGKAARLLETIESDHAQEKRKYVPFDAYGDSKLANVLFTRELAKKLPKNVKTFSLHPGVIPTNLTRSMGVIGSIYQVVGRPFMKSVPQGAATSIFAATAPELEGHSGEYLADCAIKRSSREGQDLAIAAKVWTATEKLVASAQ